MEFDIIELDTLLNAVRHDEASQRGEIARSEKKGLPGNIANVQQRLERLIAIRHKLKEERDRIVASQSQTTSHDIMDDWAGPFKTLNEAVEYMFNEAGPGKNAVWTRSDGVYINDGCDPKTGKDWVTLPEGAIWVDPGEYINCRGYVT